MVVTLRLVVRRVVTAFFGWVVGVAAAVVAGTVELGTIAGENGGAVVAAAGGSGGGGAAAGGGAAGGATGTAGGAVATTTATGGINQGVAPVASPGTGSPVAAVTSVGAPEIDGPAGLAALALLLSAAMLAFRRVGRA